MWNRLERLLCEPEKPILSQGSPGNRWSWLLALLGVALLPGCVGKHYEIEMKAQGEVIERKLTLERKVVAVEAEPVAVEPEPGVEAAQPAPAPDEEVKRVAKLYRRRLTRPHEDKQTFVDQFVGKLPKDVGGFGSHVHFATQMGTASGYVERFRGNDDLLTQLATRQQAADELTDLLIGWFRAELGANPGFDELLKFLHEDFRRDLKNLTLYSWLSAVLAPLKEDAGSEVAVRVGQYLVERGYFTPESLPTISRAIRDPSPEPSKLLLLVQRSVASKMGIADHEPIPGSLSFLGDLPLVEKSFDRYVRTTELFQNRLKKWQEEKDTKPGAEEPKPVEVARDLLGRAAFGGEFFVLFRTSDSLDVKLSCSTQPYATNGKWDDANKTVVWSAHLDAGDGPAVGLPAVFYALWSEPNAEFQTAHFGKVVLDGKELGHYCLWRRGLSDEEGREWDTFVSCLNPQDNLVKQLDAFRFSTDPARQPEEENSPPSLADMPRESIKQALKPKERVRLNAPAVAPTGPV